MRGHGNVFPIENAQEYDCTFEYSTFGQDKSFLEIVAHLHGKREFRLVFFEHYYVACPMMWKGLDFTVKSDEECEALLLRNGYGGGVMAIKKVNGLYLFSKPLASGETINIVARFAEKVSPIRKTL